MTDYKRNTTYKYKYTPWHCIESGKKIQMKNHLKLIAVQKLKEYVIDQSLSHNKTFDQRLNRTCWEYILSTSFIVKLIYLRHVPYNKTILNFLGQLQYKVMLCSDWSQSRPRPPALVQKKTLYMFTHHQHHHKPIPRNI